MTRTVVAGLWLLLAVVPWGWWLRTRRQVDIWRALPVPAALLGASGEIRDRAGPATETSFALTTGLPPAGRVARGRADDGTPVALAGLRGGGALAVALPADPVGDRRNKVLAELGSRLAHDINTPLAALHGHLDLIAHQPISPTALDSVWTCQRELTRLQTTAQDLLTFTRLRAGGGRRGRHLAGALAEEAAAGLLDRADELGASLTVQVPSEPVWVEVAEADLVRALRNLISNALAYGLGQERAVVVSVDATADDVTFTVSDSGPGLTANELEDLCQPLVRGAHVPSPGSGLGLAIVTEVLEGHGSALRTGRNETSRPHLSFSLPRQT
jgi:signal transduction histidine kinase